MRPRRNRPLRTEITRAGLVRDPRVDTGRAGGPRGAGRERTGHGPGTPRERAGEPRRPTIGPWPPTSVSASPRARPVPSTSARRGRRCSTTCSPATPAACSSCGSRTRTSPGAPRHTSATSSTASTGWASTWDEGPGVAGLEEAGPYAPYRQMQRLDSYAGAAAELLAKDAAYPCYCTPEELDADRRAQEAAKLPPRYVGRCATLTPGERAEREAEGRRRGAAVPRPARRRRLGRPRPRPGRDRHRQPRRRLRHRPGGRHAAVPLHGRGRRRGDAHQPRHPRRGPREQHAQADPALRGARLLRCRRSATSRSSSTRTARR